VIGMLGIVEGGHGTVRIALPGGSVR
jgi:hypothetical protein